MYLYVLFVLACVYVCVLGNLSWDCTCVLCFWLFRLIAEVTNLKHKNYKITIVEWRNERQRIDYLLMSSEDKRLSVVGENTFLFLIVEKILHTQNICYFNLFWWQGFGLKHWMKCQYIYSPSFGRFQNKTFRVFIISPSLNVL